MTAATVNFIYESGRKLHYTTKEAAQALGCSCIYLFKLAEKNPMHQVLHPVVHRRNGNLYSASQLKIIAKYIEGVFDPAQADELWSLIRQRELNEIMEMARDGQKYSRA
jgi:hypothetical protein